jgi:hypothetical protein
VFWLLMELWINDQPNGCHVQKSWKGIKKIQCHIEGDIAIWLGLSSNVTNDILKFNGATNYALLVNSFLM